MEAPCRFTVQINGTTYYCLETGPHSVHLIRVSQIYKFRIEEKNAG